MAAPFDLSFGGTAFPRNTEIRNYLYDRGAQGLSPRAQRLDRLDAFAKSLEYAHQAIGWTGVAADTLEAITPTAQVPYGFTQPAADLPVSQRRPTAPLRLVPMIIDRFTGLLFSLDRTPKIQVEDSPQSEEFVRQVFKVSRFWRTMYLARTYGGAMGSALITATIRKGRFAFKAHSPKIVQDIVWEDEDLRIPAAVLIQFVFFKEHAIIDGKTGMPTETVRQPYLYRRIIDSQHDIVFKPAPIGTDGKMPVLHVDPHQTIHHRLGKFPGTWVQNLPCDEEMDGIPDADGIYQMVETIDRQVAQSNKALLANQDPTLVVSRDPKLDIAGVALKKGSDNALAVGLNGSATYLEIAASGVEASGRFVGQLRQHALDRAECVIPDPDKLTSAAQSGRAIELLYGPMLVKGGRLREQWGEAVERMVDVTLTYGREYSNPEMYGTTSKPVFLLPPKIQQLPINPDDPLSETRMVRTPYEPGDGTVVSLSWGPYFSPTAAEEEAELRKIVLALSSHLIDRKVATEKAAAMFDIQDVPAMMRRIMAEIEEDRQRIQSGAAFGYVDGFEEDPPPPLPDDLPPPPAVEPVE